jgi:hypothetical protein
MRLIRKDQYRNFFIIEKGLPYNDENVYEDKHDKIKNMLFVLPFDSSFIIIKPSGEYYKYINGEYSHKRMRKALRAE